MNNTPNKTQNAITPMPNELLLALGSILKPTPEDIQRLSVTYNFPAERIQTFVSFCQKNPLPPNPNFIRPLAVAPRPISMGPQNTTTNVQTQPTTNTIKKVKEEKKEQSTQIKKMKKPEKPEEKEKKKKSTDEFSISKIPKKKDKSEIEKRVDSLMSEGNFKLENCKKLIEIMENVQDENKLYLIKSLSKNSKFSFYKKFINQNGLLILKNWLNNSPSKQLVHDIFQLLYQLPITLDDLKSSEIGKTIKKFNKLEDSINNFYSSEIKEILKKLMDKWKNIIKNEKVSLSSPTTTSEQNNEIKQEKKGIFSNIASRKEEKKKELLKSSNTESSSKSIIEHQTDNVIIENEEKENKKKRKFKQKKVTWAPQLCHVKLYEVETQEKVPTKQNSYQQEYLSEKKMFEQKRIEHEKRLENMKETTPWVSLNALIFDNSFIRGSDSEEKLIQENRRLTDTMIQYQKDSEIPNTPTSPISSSNELSSSKGDENILQTLTSDPNLLTQLLGMLQQPTTNESVKQPEKSTNPYSTIQSSTNPYSTIQQTSTNFYSSVGSMSGGGGGGGYTTSINGSDGDSYQSNPYQSSNPYSSISNYYSTQNTQPGYSNEYSQMLKQQIPSVQSQQPYSVEEMNDPTTQQRCKFYNTPTGCKKGSNCQYLHSRDDYRI
eukprot:gene1688-457_t